MVSGSAIQVTKEANGTAAVGESINYTYRVFNIGAATLNNITASDDRLGDVPLDRTTLSSGTSATGVLTYTLTVNDLPGPLTNTVIAWGKALNSDTLVTDTDIATVTFHLDKTYLPAILKALSPDGP